MNGRSIPLVDLAKFVQDLPSTESIYLEDSYLQSSAAEVLRVAQEKNNVYLALDRTIFHPRSGGQPSDRGTVEGSSYHVEMKRAMLSGDVVVHYGKVKGNAEAAQVICKIDWPNRFLMMRRHTAAHLLDYCLATLRSSHVETTDSWLGDDPYVGYDGLAPSQLDLERIQELANDFIQRGRTVEVVTMDRAEAERLIVNAPNIARLPKSEKLRIVTIEGQLPIPCGGTHVRNIGEIGAVEVRRTEPAEVGFRLHFEVS